MVAPSAPRDARSKIPPGPEGSNGIGRCGCRGQPAGPSPFPCCACQSQRFALQILGPRRCASDSCGFAAPPYQGGSAPERLLPLSSRKARKVLTYAKMAANAPEYALALSVKAADRLANICACVADSNTAKLETYRDEHTALRSATFRPGDCDGLWQEMDALLAANPA